MAASWTPTTAARQRVQAAVQALGGHDGRWDRLLGIVPAVRCSLREWTLRGRYERLRSTLSLTGKGEDIIRRAFSR